MVGGLVVWWFGGLVVWWLGGLVVLHQLIGGFEPGVLVSFSFHSVLWWLGGGWLPSTHGPRKKKPTAHSEPPSTEPKPESPKS